MNNLKGALDSLTNNQEVGQFPYIINITSNYVYHILKKYVSDNDFKILFPDNILQDLKESEQLITDFTESNIKNEYVKNSVRITGKLNLNQFEAWLKDNKIIIDRIKLTLADTLEDVTPPLEKTLFKLTNSENNTKAQSEMANLIQEDLNLIGVADNSRKIPRVTTYKYNENLKTYEEFTTTDLTNYLNNISPDITVNFKPDMYFNLLSRVNNIKEIQSNYVELSNCYINTDNYNITYKEDKKIFCTHKLTMTNYNNEQQLLTYDPNITYETIALEDIQPMYKVFKEITISKETGNNDLFKLMLQLIGYAVLSENRERLIVLLYDVTSHGKSTLIDIIKTIFPNVQLMGDKTLNDQFLTNVLNTSKHMLINEEFKIDDFKKYNQDYKRLSGGTGQTGRSIGTAEIIEVNKIPLLLLATNDNPNINPEDKALLRRLLLLQLPNTFTDDVTNPDDLQPNEYIAKPVDNILSDVAGANQLLSCAINEFLKIDRSKSIRSQLAVQQSYNDKVAIITNDNPLRLFVTTKIRIMENLKKTDYILNKDIKIAYKEWYKRQYKSILTIEDNKLSQQIGLALKEKFGNKLDSTVLESTAYNIKIIDDRTITNEYNKILNVIDPSAKVTGNTLRVYDNIIHGTNTMNKLFKNINDLKHEDIIANVEYLENQGIIEKTSNISID